MVFPRHNHHEPFLQHVGTGKWMHMAIFTDNYINPIGSMVLLYGNMDPINIPPMLAYIPYMDPMGTMIKTGF